MNKSERLRFLGVLVLGLVLRCAAINSRSIQYDDAFSILLSQQNLANIIQGTAADTMPPLYYFLLHAWMKIGNSLWFLRLLSVILSLAILIVLYALVRRLFDPQAAFWASLLAAISPLQIYHAQDIRMYALLAFCQLVYFWCFVEIFYCDKKPAAIYWIGLVISGALAMYSHNLAVFGLSVPLIYLLIRRRWRLLSQILLADLLIGGLALPWMVMLPGQIAKIQTAFWTPRPGSVEVFQAIILFTATLPLPGFGLVVAAIASVQILFLVIFENWKDQTNRPGLFLLTTLATLPPLLLFIGSYLMRPIFVPRGFLVSSLAFYGLGGRAISRRGLKGSGLLILSLFIVCAVISLPYQISYREFPRSPFKETAQYLASNVVEDDLIIHDNKLSFFPVYYFNPSLPQIFLADPPGTHNDTLAPSTQKALGLYPKAGIEETPTSVAHVYYIVFLETIQEYRSLGYTDHPSLEWLRSKFPNESFVRFDDLEVYRFSQ